MNFINLYSRVTHQEELRIMLGLPHYIVTANYLASPRYAIDLQMLQRRMIDRFTPPGPGYGWGYYYDTFADAIRRWLK